MRGAQGESIAEWWQMWYTVSPNAAVAAARQHREDQAAARSGSAPARSGWGARPQPRIVQRARRQKPSHAQCAQRAEAKVAARADVFRRKPMRLLPSDESAMLLQSVSHACAHVALPDPAAAMSREWRAAARRGKQPVLNLAQQRPGQQPEQQRRRRRRQQLQAQFTRQLRREFCVRPNSAGAGASYDDACGNGLLDARHVTQPLSAAQCRVQWPATPPRRGLSTARAHGRSRGTEEYFGNFSS